MPLDGCRSTYLPPHVVADTADATFNRLLRNQEGTDFTIICGAKEHKVHRLVLSMHSDVLSRACNGGFKVRLVPSRWYLERRTNRPQEAQDSRLDLSEDGEACVTSLIDYVYLFEYKNDPSPSYAALEVKMAVMADKYNMPHLQELALEHFKKRFPIKIVDSKLPRGFDEAAREAYEIEGPTQPFRDAILEGLRSLKLSEETFVAVSDLHPGLATDLLRETHRRITDLERKLRKYKSYLCVHCDEVFPAKAWRGFQEPCCPVCCTEGVPWGEALDGARFQSHVTRNSPMELDRLI